MGSGEFRDNLFQPDGSIANSWLGPDDSERIWSIIAGAIPAASFATGHNKILGLAANMDMNGALKSPHWPDRGGGAWLRRNWLHSDAKNMAYIYTENLFNEMVDMGGLE